MGLGGFRKPAVTDSITTLTHIICFQGSLCYPFSMGAKSKHYFKTGKEHKGAYHKMPDGSLHSGKTHTKTSKVIVHFKDLSKTAKKRAKA